MSPLEWVMKNIVSCTETEGKKKSKYLSCHHNIREEISQWENLFQWQLYKWGYHLALERSSHWNLDGNVEIKCSNSIHQMTFCVTKHVGWSCMLTLLSRDPRSAGVCILLEHFVSISPSKFQREDVWWRTTINALSPGEIVWSRSWWPYTEMIRFCAF